MKYGISYVIGLKSGQTRQNRFDVVIIHGKMPDLFTMLLNMGSEVEALDAGEQYIRDEGMFGTIC